MLFKERFHRGIIDGSVTLTFRAWSRPQAKAGGRQRFGAYDGDRESTGFLEIDAVDLVPVSSITDAEARRAGFDGKASLVAQLRETARTRITANSKVYRVSFRFVRARDERAALAEDASLSREDVAALAERLDRMDARANAPWTRETLAAIASQSGVSASILAGQLGRERLAFKQDVRKLKALGLTISLETGYKLSPRGRAFLRRRR
jgi:hypothetical protein